MRVLSDRTEHRMVYVCYPSRVHHYQCVQLNGHDGPEWIHHNRMYRANQHNIPSCGWDLLGSTGAQQRIRSNYLLVCWNYRINRSTCFGSICNNSWYLGKYFFVGWSRRRAAYSYRRTISSTSHARIYTGYDVRLPDYQQRCWRRLLDYRTKERGWSWDRDHKRP